MGDAADFEMPDLTPRRRGGGSQPARLDVEQAADLLDARTEAGQVLLAYRADLVAALGGPDHLTALQERLVEGAVMARAYLEIAHAWALQNLRAKFGTDDTIVVWLTALDRLQAREDTILRRLGLGAKVRRPRNIRELRRMEADE